MAKTMDNDMSMVEELPIYILPRCIVKFLNTVDDRNGDADGKILCSCTVNFYVTCYFERHIIIPYSYLYVLPFI